MPRSIRRVATLGALAIAVLLTVVAGLFIIQALPSHVSRESATTIALNKLHEMNASVTGYVLVSARYQPTPDRIYDDSGNLIASESGSACFLLYLKLPRQLCGTDALWILHFHAPAQGTWANYDAYVVVKASNGTVSSASLVGR